MSILFSCALVPPSLAAIALDTCVASWALGWPQPERSPWMPWWCTSRIHPPLPCPGKTNRALKVTRAGHGLRTFSGYALQVIALTIITYDKGIEITRPHICFPTPEGYI